MSPASKPGPYTGKEYLDSLNDGREAWIRGERVKDIVNHPAFRNSARMFARLYDALHDPDRTDLMTIPIDNGSGMRTHRFFQASHTVEEQIAARDTIAEWARMGYGWLGRTPDYKAAWIGTLACNSGLYEEYQPNADRWYDVARERVPYIIMRLFIRPWIDISPMNRSMYLSRLKRKPMKAWSSAVRKSWLLGRRLRNTPSSLITTSFTSRRNFPRSS